MSRISDAWKHAAETEASPEDRHAGALAEVRGHDARSTRSPLEQYAAERSVERGESVAPRPVHLAVAPPTDTPVRRIALTPPPQAKLVGRPNIGAATVEQYRRLAAVLHDFQLQNGLKTLMVSSAVPGEGKTLTIANLALTLGDSYRRRVLLIDANLRSPSVHQVFGFRNQAGFADLGRRGGRVASIVEISNHLSVMPAGHVDASPLAHLTSGHVRAFVEDAAQRFDWVLMDTPPIHLLPDAQIVARLCEGIVLVIAAGTTPCALVQRAVGELGAERIVGVVLNRVDKRVLNPDERYGAYYGRRESR